MSDKKHMHGEAEQVCGCGCGCDEENDIVELVDEDGNAVKFSHVATIDYQNEWYVFFTPAEEVEGVSSEEVVIFKLDSDDEGKDVFSPIEDEELLQKVYDEYLKVIDEDDEEYDDEDEDDGCSSGCGSCGGCG